MNTTQNKTNEEPVSENVESAKFRHPIHPYFTSNSAEETIRRMRGFPERAAKFQEKFNEEKMDKVKDNKARHASQLPSPAYRRHPLTLDNPKDVMFERMATVKERIAAFEEKLDADRKKNSR